MADWRALASVPPGATDHIRALCDDLCCKTREESGIATGLTLIHVECVAGSPAEINKVSLQVFHKALGHVIGAHPDSARKPP